jgi:hypothetical protein
VQKSLLFLTASAWKDPWSNCYCFKSSIDLWCLCISWLFRVFRLRQLSLTGTVSRVPHPQFFMRIGVGDWPLPIPCLLSLAGLAVWPLVDENVPHRLVVIRQGLGEYVRDFDSFGTSMISRSSSKISRSSSGFWWDEQGMQLLNMYIKINSRSFISRLVTNA